MSVSDQPHHAKSWFVSRAINGNPDHPVHHDVREAKKREFCSLIKLMSYLSTLQNKGTVRFAYTLYVNRYERLLLLFDKDLILQLLVLTHLCPASHKKDIGKKV